MKNQTDMLDPLAESDLSNDEEKIVEDAADAGKNLASTVPGESDEALTGEPKDGGIIGQTINSKAVAGFGQPGDESDISGGIANLDETAGKKVDENEYNE